MRSAFLPDFKLPILESRPKVPKLGLVDNGYVSKRSVESRSPQRVLNIAPLYGINEVNPVTIIDRFHTLLGNPSYPSPVGKYDLFAGTNYSYSEEERSKYRILRDRLSSIDSNDCSRSLEAIGTNQ